MRHKTLENWLRQLQRTSSMRNTREFDKYREALEHLKLRRSATVLRAILASIKDVEAGEFQYEAVEACERFPMEKYIREFVNVIPNHWRHGRQWYTLMLCTILNMPGYRKTFFSEIEESETRQRTFWKRRLTWLATKHMPKYYKYILKEMARHGMRS